MFRKRYRNDTTTLPFRIRNNFSRRLLTRFDYTTIPRPQGTTASGNDDDEIMLQDYFENNEDNELLGQQSSNDEEEGENHEDNDSMLSQQSNNDEGDDVDMMIISSEIDDATSEGNNDEYDDDDDDDDDDDEYEYDDDYDDDEYEYDDDDENDNDDEYEYNTTSSESGGDYANTLSKEKLFVDTALDGDKLPYNNPSSDNPSSDFAPYFQNFTTAALFFWIYKHNISTNAYEDLVDIIMNPAFNKDHIIRNIRRFRTWRQYLPLLPISATSIPISSKKTQSTSKDSKMSYQLSINDIIWNILNNPSLYNDMYFGPGVNSETKSEYWHGTLWAESPLFGQEQLIVSGGNDIYLFDMFMIDLMTYFDIF
jgi:hypothetical protein